MEIVNGELIVTYTDNTTQNLGSLYGGNDSEEINDTESGLIYKLLPDGTYGVRVGSARNNTSITIPSTYNEKNVTAILENGFEGCPNLTTIAIPNTITAIKDSAFKDCKLLSSISLPSNLKSIGKYAFNNCSAITTVTIPSNTTFIGAFAFYGTALTNATFENAKNWIAGDSGFDSLVLTSNTAGTGGIYYLRISGFSISDSENAAQALTTSVSKLLHGSVYQNRYWYTQDWVRIE